MTLVSFGDVIPVDYIQINCTDRVMLPCIFTTPIFPKLINHSLLKTYLIYFFLFVEF